VLAEHVRRLYHVVVHADHDEIVGVHGHHPVMGSTSLRNTVNHSSVN
jgi:hypothetical protein